MHLLAWHALRVAGRENRGACNIAALLANRLRAAEHDIVDQCGVEAIALRQRG